MAGLSGTIVGIIDYQSGNVRSITNAFETLGARVVLIRDAADVSSVSHMVLPGVGAFGFCAEKLTQSGLIPAIHEWTFAMRRPMLGICVGMQLLAQNSDELGMHDGLGWFEGVVRRLHADSPLVRIPHVGWNTAVFEQPFGDFAVGDSSDFYFDHAYAFQPQGADAPLALSTHGQTFAAALRRDNLVAAQFHPEKSQAAGMRFLRGFLEL